MEAQRITPTKKNPIYTATCDYFGCIEESLYKEWEVKEGSTWYCGRTFGINFRNAVDRLHEWIQENTQVVKEFPKCKFTLELVTGELNSYGEVKHEVVYSISAAKAKRFLM